jgi:hypothetical protein
MSASLPGLAILDSVPLPNFHPLPLTRRPEPFSHPDWLFEVKYDGFRAFGLPRPLGSAARLTQRQPLLDELHKNITAGWYAWRYPGRSSSLA